LTTDLIGALHPLLADYRALRDRHGRTLAPYRDQDGDVAERGLRDYDEERTTTALEAAEALDGLLDRLTDLVGPPLPGTPHTLTYAGWERYDGEAPYSFVVCAENLEAARRILVTLPSYRHWYDEQRDGEGEPADVLYRPNLSHAGVPNAHWWELRREQADQQAALDADARDAAAPDDDLHAVLRAALRDWCTDHHMPIPATVHIRAEREDGSWRMRLESDHAALHYADGTQALVEAGFERTFVEDALAEINAERTVANDGLTVRLLPKNADDVPAV